MQMHRYQVIVHGRVQGVGFRYGTSRIANRYGITGSVENLADGTVKIFAEGKENNLDNFLTEIKHGPTPYAKVTTMTITELPLANDRLFRIK